VSAPPLPRRVIDALRHGGVRELWWRALGVTVYRRLQLYLRDVDAPHEPGPPDVVVRLLDDVDDYLAARSGAPRAEVERRLARGDVCGIGWLGDEVVGTRWLSFGVAEIEYLDLAFEIAPSLGYVYDVWTRPDQRGSGVNRSLSTWSANVIRERGGRYSFSAILAENRGGSSIPGTLPMRPAGTLGCLRLLGRRIDVRRGVPDDVLGRATRL
jgi:hypothetical protein